MKVKKILALALAGVMTLSMGMMAFAANGDTTTDMSTVTIKKVYKLVGEGTSPAETFTLEQFGVGTVKDGDATSAPALSTITGATFAEGAASAVGTVGDITVQLPTYEKVGIYEYTLKEVNNGKAGVTYRNDNIKLVVTVMQGTDGKIRVAAVHTEDENGEKSDSFENTYSAGTLKVSKTVAGNLADHDKYFEFEVTLTGETDKTYGDSYTVSGGSSDENPTSITIGNKAYFKLKDGETISIKNLPYGVNYVVTETVAEGYTTEKTGDTGSINDAEQTAAFTNTKNGEVDTGISLDNLPYILLLCLAAFGAAALFFKKRNALDR